MDRWLGPGGLAAPSQRWHRRRCKRRLITIWRKKKRPKNRPNQPPTRTPVGVQSQAAKRMLPALARAAAATPAVATVGAWAIASAIAAWANLGRSKIGLRPCCNGTTYGGWFAFGYYNDNDRLSPDRQRPVFLDNPDHLNLDQAWFYVEKLAKGDAAGTAVTAPTWSTVSTLRRPKPSATRRQRLGYDNVGQRRVRLGLAASVREVRQRRLDIKVGHFFTPLATK